MVGGLPAYQACLRGSGDTTYLSDGAVGHTSIFECAEVPEQTLGFISGLSFYVRARATAVVPGTQLDCSIDFGFGPIAVISFNPADTNWTVMQVRLHYDGVNRLTTALLGSLVPQVTVQTGFPPGPNPDTFQVSEIWLDVEYCDTLEYYDPIAFAQIPSTVAYVYLNWNSQGTAPATLVPATGFLKIEDASAVDYRRFHRSNAITAPRTLADDFDSEICQRVTLISNFDTIDGCVYRIAILEDGQHSVWLNIVRSGGVDYLGLISGTLNVDVLSQYYVTTPLTGGLISTVSRHFHLLVNRQDSVGQVQVFLDYGETPVLQFPYDQFATTANNRLEFGTGEIGHWTNQITAHVDFVSWRHWQARGARFADWCPEFSEVNRVSVDVVDPYTAYPVTLPSPYPLGQRVGQSDYCCSLAVVNNAEYSWTKQTWWLPAGYSSCNVAVTYRMDAVGTVAEFLIQRTDDHMYWNQAATNWLVATTAVTMPNSMLRTTQVIATGVTPTAGKGITVQIRPVLGTGLGNLKIYHVQLIPVV